MEAGRGAYAVTHEHEWRRWWSNMEASDRFKTGQLIPVFGSRVSQIFHFARLYFLHPAGSSNQPSTVMPKQRHPLIRQTVRPCSTIVIRRPFRSLSLP